MSLLTTVQFFCERTGVPRPNTVYGSSEPQILQIRALLEEEGNDLKTRMAWEGITFEATHTTTATESQGDMDTLATNGYRYIKTNTLWDRTDQLPIWGPATDAEWQQYKAIITTGPRYIFRIRGNEMIVNPVPVAGNTWAFEYVSKNWILKGSTYKQYFTDDADEMLLPESILLSGLRWRWKKEKGLEYAEDFRTYENQVKDTMARDGGNRRLYMDETLRQPTPGLFVPQGSWNI